MRTLKHVLAFYQSIVLVNLAISVGAGLLGGMGNFAGSFLAFGFALSIIVKEVNAKPEYVFYRNNGLSRFQLWAWSYGVNLAVFLVISSLFIVCRNMFWK